MYGAQAAELTLSVINFKFHGGSERKIGILHVYHPSSYLIKSSVICVSNFVLVKVVPKSANKIIGFPVKTAD